MFTNITNACTIIETFKNSRIEKKDVKFDEMQMKIERFCENEINL